MYKRKNRHIRFGKVFTVFAVTGLLWQCCGRMVMADDSQGLGEANAYESEMIGDVEIFIYTRSDETYEITGTLEILQEGKRGKETIMELEGELVKNRNTKDLSQYNTKELAEPTVLTVYMNEQIYGFYSNHKIEKYNRSGKEQIFIYGFLEGYYDGEKAYSA